MNSGIRDEIRNVLSSEDAYLDDEALDREYCIEEILKLFEKRIDEIQSTGDGNYFGYSGDQEFIDGFDIGFDEAFKLIKKEMLK